MKLHHQTEVAASPEQVWDFLQDTRAVVECLPGAELQEELGGDRYQGVLRVGVGPLKMQYAGEVSVVERNAAERRITLDASGRDKRGSGTVQAHVQLKVVPDGQGSMLDVGSDLTLTGRIASLGRGIRDVSNRMFVDFAAQLSDRIVNPEGSAAPAEHGSPVGSGEANGAQGSDTMSRHGTTSSAPRVSPADSPAGGGGEIKIMPLLVNVTRAKLAGFLARLSERLNPQ